MKAIILAAGQGTRIRSVHGEHPKCLIEVDDATILDHQLEALSMAGIKEVAIVVGYEKEQIIAHVRSKKLSYNQRIHFIENPAFANSQTISIRFGSQSIGCAATVLSSSMLMSSSIPKFSTPLRNPTHRSR